MIVLLFMLVLVLVIVIVSVIVSALVFVVCDCVSVSVCDRGGGGVCDCVSVSVSVSVLCLWSLNLYRTRITIGGDDDAFGFSEAAPPPSGPSNEKTPPVSVLRTRGSGSNIKTLHSLKVGILS